MAAASNQDGDSLTLNIMPMLDVFSILIVFLLMSYSTDPVSYDINAGIELPESNTMQALDEIPTIAITSTEILINDKKVANIIKGDVPEKDRSQGAVYPVYEELRKLAEASKRIRRRLTPEDKKKTETLTMEMDQDHRFKLMKRVMLSAQQAEFITFKMMVSRRKR
jgi:biopolymer transport protein ExbD